MPQTTLTERRWDWGAWLTLAVAAGWCVLTISASALALEYPSDGWTIRRNSLNGAIVLNDYFHADPSPLLTDDVVLAIEGQVLGPNSRAPVRAGTPAGAILRYTVRRAGRVLEVPVTLHAPGAAGLWPVIRNRWAETPRDFVVATIAFGVTLAAFWARPGNLGARYLLLAFSYYFAVQWFGFANSDLYTALVPVWLATVVGLEGTAWFWYLFPCMTLTALSFPVVKWPLRRFPRALPALLIGVPAAAGLAAYGSYHAHGDPGSLSLVLPVFLTMIGLAMVTLAAALIHNWLTLRDPATRAQLRWVTLGLALGILLPFGWLLVGLLFTGTFPAGLQAELVLWLPILVPVTLAIAIVRYRLFDIDVIIRRTLIYSALTALLALTYFGLVIVLQGVVGALGGTRSEWVTVASTLAVAALVAPLRARVQGFIDRRFFRRKYNSAQTLAGFATVARDETDLNTLTGKLAGVVREAVEPESVTVWLRPAADLGRPEQPA